MENFNVDMRYMEMLCVYSNIGDSDDYIEEVRTYLGLCRDTLLEVEYIDTNKHVKAFKLINDIRNSVSELENSRGILRFFKSFLIIYKMSYKIDELYNIVTELYERDVEEH